MDIDHSVVMDTAEAVVMDTDDFISAETDTSVAMDTTNVTVGDAVNEVVMVTEDDRAAEDSDATEIGDPLYGSVEDVAEEEVPREDAADEVSEEDEGPSTSKPDRMVATIHHRSSRKGPARTGRDSKAKAKSGASPYKQGTATSGLSCDICGQHYAKSDSLRKHMARKHIHNVVDETLVKEALEEEPKARKTRQIRSKYTDADYNLDDSINASKYKEYIKKVEDGLECGLCGREYPRLNPLRRHLMCHFESSDPAAFHSNRRSIKEREEINCLAETTVTGAHRCKECGIEYDKWNSLRAHIVRRHITCSLDQLTKTRSRKSTEEAAKYIKDDNGRFLCLICAAVNTSQEIMFIHLRNTHIRRGPASDRDTSDNSVTVNDGQQCKICFDIFHDDTTLRYHVKWHTTSRNSSVRIRCEHCSAVFAKDNLDAHMRAKHIELLPSEICPVCEVEVEAKDWKVHQRGHKALQKGLGRTRRRNSQEFLCDQCAAPFKSKKALLKHLTSHLVPRNVAECTVCHREILACNMDRHLRLHERRRLGLDERMCEHCGRKFIDSSALKRHIDQVHLGLRDGRTKRFACRQCPKVYTSITSLKYHLNWHAGVRPYVCEVCNKRFMYKGSLRAHRIVHTDNKPFECRYCDKAFRFKGVWYRHECTHTGERPYKCEDCGRQFIQQHVFARHSCASSGRRSTLVSGRDTEIRRPPSPPVPCPPPLEYVPNCETQQNFNRSVFHPLQYSAYATDDTGSRLLASYESQYQHFVTTPFVPSVVPSTSMAAHMAFRARPEPELNQHHGGMEAPNHVQRTPQAPTPIHSPRVDKAWSKVERLDPSLYRPRTPPAKLCMTAEPPPVKVDTPRTHTTGEDAFQEFLRQRACPGTDTAQYTDTASSFRNTETTASFSNDCVVADTKPEVRKKVEKLIIKLPQSPAKKAEDRRPVIKEDDEETEVEEFGIDSSDDDMYVDADDASTEQADDASTEHVDVRDDAEDGEDPYVDDDNDDDEDNADLAGGVVGETVEDVGDAEIVNEDKEQGLESEGKKKDGKGKSSSEASPAPVFQCRVCDKEFRRKSAVSAHERKQHPELGPQTYCQQCDKFFQSQARLRDHLLVHTGEKPHACPHCPAAFRTPGALKTHVRIHTGEKPYKCHICNSEFRFHGNYRRHLELHNETSNFVCDVCGKEFKVRDHLGRHRKSHEGHRNYSCEICGARFGLSTTLKKHLQSHSDERPYICSVCGNGFKRLPHLKRHEEIHQEKKPTERLHCSDPLCTTTFASKDALRNHMKRLHESTPKARKPCRYCSKTFSDNTNLVRHEGRHFGMFRYPCPQCEKGFDKPKELERHLNVHANGRAKWGSGRSRKKAEASVAPHYDTYPAWGATGPLNLAQ